MKFKIFIITLVFLCTFITLVSAVEITLKVEPYHKIIFRIINPDSNAELKSFYPVADENGEAVVNYDTTLSVLSFLVITKHPLDSIVISQKNIDDVEVESSIYLDVLEGSVGEPIPINPLPNEPTNNVLDGGSGSTPPVISDSSLQSSDGSITGAAISGAKLSGISTILVIMGISAIVAILVLLLIISRVRRTIPSLNKATKTKTFNRNINNDVSVSNVELSLRDEMHLAEQKIREAQEELHRLKQRRSEVDIAEDEYRKAKEKLEKLKGNRSQNSVSHQRAVSKDERKIPKQNKSTVKNDEKSYWDSQDSK